MNPIYDQMSAEARKNYNLTNWIRIISMFIGYALVIVIFVVYAVNIKEDFLPGFGMAAFFGSMIHAAIHHGFLFRKVGKACIRIPLIPLNVLVTVTVWSYILGLGMFAGPVYLVIDLIFFIRKKPLIYAYENKRYLVMQGQAVQAGYAAGQGQPAGYAEGQAVPAGYTAGQGQPAGYAEGQAAPTGYAVGQGQPTDLQ